MTIAGLWRYGDWQHVATGCNALVQFQLGVTVHRCRRGNAAQNLVDCCKSTTDAVCHQRLRSASRHQLIVPRHRRTIFGRFFVVYRPPHHRSDDMKLLTECLYRYTAKSHANIVTGDFNCPGINWSTLHTQNDGVHNVFFGLRY